MEWSWNPVRALRSPGAPLAAAAALAAALAATPASSGGAGPPGGDTLGAAEAAAICLTYANRSRFLPRDGRVDFVVVLSETCASAARALDAPGPEARREARRVLAGLARLRAVTLALNMESAYGRSGALRPEAGGLVRRLRAVSGTGEFLIAHSMGLLPVLESWRTRDPGIPVARR